MFTATPKNEDQFLASYDKREFDAPLIKPKGSDSMPVS